MIRAILFDCNGVIADDEPIHLLLFQKVLKEEGIQLTKKEYFQKYLALDDRSCFKDALKAHGREAPDSMLSELIRRKAAYYQKMIKKNLRIFSGVQSFIKKHEKEYVLAVVSGALKNEIDLILRRSKIAEAFSLIVSAENIKNGKPSPDCYLHAFNGLRKLGCFKKKPLRPNECVAIEDSIHGVEAARKAGMKCIAVTNSYSKKELENADCVVKSLEGLEIKNLTMGSVA